MMTNTIQTTTQPMEMPSFAGYEKRTYTVDEIQDILSIGRNSAYELVKSGDFKCIRVGRTIRVSKKSFDEWLDSQL